VISDKLAPSRQDFLHYRGRIFTMQFRHDPVATAGQSPPSSAARRSLPLASAQHSPNSPATRQNFRAAQSRALAPYFSNPRRAKNASK